MNRTMTCVGAVAVLMLSGCGNGGKGSAPSGQVVAKVGGDEITQRELMLELNGFSSEDPQQTKQAQQAALAAIVNRKLFARAAEDAGIGKSPEFQLSRHRMEELSLVQAYEQQLASKVTPPTEQEIERYKEQHPNTFAQRKLYAVDQIKIGKSLDPKLLEQLKPLHSLDDVERALLGAGVDYIRAPGSIDARLVSPKVMDQITKLPPNEPFVMPVGNMIVISQITKATTLPLTGQPANELARQALLAERRTKAIADRLSQLRKEAGEIKYQNGYSPSKATAQEQ